MSRISDMNRGSLCSGDGRLPAARAHAALGPAVAGASDISTILGHGASIIDEYRHVISDELEAADTMHNNHTQEGTHSQANVLAAR